MEAQIEYENSKDLVRNITSGFSQQLRRLVGSIGAVEKGVADSQLFASEALKTSVEAVEAVKDTSERVSELSGKMDDTYKKIESLQGELQSLSRRRPVAAVQPPVDAAIPLGQDAVLERLTPTELGVLMLIEDIGEASGPAIRERNELVADRGQQHNRGPPGGRGGPPGDRRRGLGQRDPRPYANGAQRRAHPGR